MLDTTTHNITSIWRRPLLFVYLTARKYLSGKGLRRFAFIDRGYALVSAILKHDGVLVNGYIMYYDVVNGIDCAGQTSGGQIYEHDLVNFFRKEIHEGDSVVDLGAETGYFTCLFAKLVGPSGAVFAFEANPKNFAYLKKNMEVNGFSHVTLVPGAVSDRTGQEKFFARGPNSALAYDRFKDGRDMMTVETATLDSFFETCGAIPEISVMKIDIEGSEAKAFRGMEKFLRKNPQMKIVMEFYPILLRAAGDDPLAFLRRLADLGFVFYDMESQEGMTLSRSVTADDLVAKCSSPNSPMTNILCMRK